MFYIVFFLKKDVGGQKKTDTGNLFVLSAFLYSTTQHSSASGLENATI